MGVGLAGDNRLLFMPHSPGVYIALVLKDGDEMEQDQLIQSEEAKEDLKQSVLISHRSQISLGEGTQNQPKHQTIQNYLFLDVTSLSKSFQTILSKFMMIVIARVSSICKAVASEQANPYGLPKGTVYYQCQISKIENIVGFEGDNYGITNYQCAAYKIK